MKDLLPAAYLRIIARECPLALETYIHLWQSRDDDNKVLINLKSAPERFLISRTKIRNHIRHLAAAMLLNYEPHGKFVSVEMVTWDVEHFE